MIRISHHPCLSQGLAFSFLLLPGIGGLAGTRAGEPAEVKAAGWHLAKTEQLKGLKVSLSTPVCVHRAKGHLWFPTLIRRPGGDLLAVMSNYADMHTTSSTSLASWSADGGLTWSKPSAGAYSDSHLVLPNGDLVLLPYYLYPRPQGMGAPYQIVPRGKRELRLVKEGLTVSGWPRKDRSFDPKLGLSGFVFNGQTVRLKDGTYLATLYGHFGDDARYSLVAAESGDGQAWKIRAVIADPKAKALKGNEGPCEAALARLTDGRLLCVFRQGPWVIDKKKTTKHNFGHAFSGDDGKTWTEPALMPDDVFSVQPSLVVLKDGTVVLSGGRPGLYLWLDTDGTARAWQKVELHTHHNACHPKQQVNTTGYTEVVALDERNLLYIYDRIPHHWKAVPESSPESNSVWVVRITVEKTKASK